MKYLILLISIVLLVYGCSTEQQPQQLSKPAFSTTDTSHHDKASMAMPMPKLQKPLPGKVSIKHNKFGITYAIITLAFVPNAEFNPNGKYYDSIYLPAHTGQGHVLLMSVAGTAAKPTVVTNVPGAYVDANDPSGDAGIEFAACSFIKFISTAVPGHAQGIHAGQGGTFCFDAHYGSTNIEIANIEMSGSTYGGLGFRTYPTEGSQWSTTAGWAIRGMNIHDNNIHDVPGEAMYLGQSHYGNQDANGYNPVSGNPLGSAAAGIESPITDAIITHNTIKNAGYDGIQLSGCIDPLKCIVSYNTIIGFGGQNTDGQDGGITFNPGSVGTISHNWIEYNGTGNFSMGIMYQGQGDTYITDNVFKSNGRGQVAIAMLRNTQANVKGSTHTGNLKFINNTISGWTTGYWWYGQNGFGNSPNTTFENQIIQQTPTISSIGNGSLSNLNIVTSVQVTGNAGLNSDLTLAAGSQAINFGTNELALVPIDYNGKNWNAKYDAGAFVFGAGGVTPPTDSVILSVSPDQNITLGSGVTTTTVTLTSSATSTTGSAITSYLWQGNSGTITAPASNNTTVTGLTAGNYSFSITAKDAAGTSGVAITNVHIAAASTGSVLNISLTPGTSKTVAIPAGATSVVATASGCAACPVVPPVRTVAYINCVGAACTVKFSDSSTQSITLRSATIK